jgi:hypothetical protein
LADEKRSSPHSVEHFALDKGREAAAAATEGLAEEAWEKAKLRGGETDDGEGG